MKMGTLGSTISKLRKEKGWSLRKLAKEAKISFPYLYEIEQGSLLPKPDKLERIAGALNVNHKGLEVLATRDRFPAHALETILAEEYNKLGNKKNKNLSNSHSELINLIKELPSHELEELIAIAKIRLSKIKK
jgi:transcriptional regulator with XRE-family HTH domain